MRAVLQRVERAQVSVDGQVCGEIGAGLLVYLAVQVEDTSRDVAWMERKILNLRVFADTEGRFNRSLLDVAAGVLLVSQFTLYGDCRKGNRPSFTRSAPSETARALYEELLGDLRAAGVPTAGGTFQAHMKVDSVNDGPVTLVLDSRMRL